jgi:SAM-dependent methyltransferase
MELTGFFPKENENVPKLPLELAKCEDCGLTQLYHNFDVGQLYGETYGYRSGLNVSMINHLNDIADELTSLINICDHDNILDIGSNDGTFLGCYKKRKNINFLGIDPSANKFRNYYKNDIDLIINFFSKEIITEKYNNKKFAIVTTVAMFYDLPDPIKFAQDICDILKDDGIWFSEQSYCISMIKATSFDTICHEHIEYYCFKQFKHICDIVGMKIVKLEFNNINGGSFNCVVTKKTNHKLVECPLEIELVLNNETEFWKTNPIEILKNNIELTNSKLFQLFDEINNNNKIIHGYGASTKGNVLLQYFNIKRDILKYICEVNEYKFGKYTPGTLIPIISDTESKNLRPDYYFVLPWHFRDNIINKEIDYLKSGGKLIFPLPKLEIISYNNEIIIQKI